MRLTTAGLALCLGIAGLAACGSDPSDLPPPPTTTIVATTIAASPEGADLAVTDQRGQASGGAYPEVALQAEDNAFVAEGIRIDPGVTVAWTNVGRNPHNIVPDEGKEFGVAQESFEPGGEYEFKFDKPGVYAYYCSLHGTPTKGMRGVIVVGDAEYPPAGGATTTVPLVSGTIHVPADQPTIQAAVDVASSGSFVLVAPGVYKEAVTVTTDNIVIRGEDRNTVILDGGFTLENGIKVVGAGGVAIENMTARNYKVNGFFWTGVKGYRGSYLTAYNNADYGIYAFDSVSGQFDHSYASGSPDSGFYIGECDPCDAVVIDVMAENSQLGYSGTNSTGVKIVRSVFRNNRAGIVPNTLDSEKLPPVRDNLVVGNLVYDNNNGDAAKGHNKAFDSVFGAGIAVVGGTNIQIERNRVANQDRAGIVIAPNPAIQENWWSSKDNQVVDNVVTSTSTASLDLALITVGGPGEPTPFTGGNCFEGNTYKTSGPADIETLLPCTGTGTGDPNNGAVDIAPYLDTSHNPVPKPVADQPVPPPQDQMPNAKTAPPVPATPGVVPLAVDIDAIAVPTYP
jgi:plastocyanin